MRCSYTSWMSWKESYRCWTTSLPQSKKCLLNQRKKKKWKNLKIFLKEATRICIQGHEYSNNLHQLCPTQKICKEWTSNLVDWKKFLTEEAKELNLPKTKLEDQLLQIYSLYSMTNTLIWFQKISAYEKERFKTIIVLVQIELPKNESTTYQESNFSVLPTTCLTFRKI